MSHIRPGDDVRILRHAASALLLLVAACSGSPVAPTATPDRAVLATEVARQVEATVSAFARLGSGRSDVEAIAGPPTPSPGMTAQPTEVPSTPIAQTGVSGIAAAASVSPVVSPSAVTPLPAVVGTPADRP